MTNSPLNNQDNIFDSINKCFQKERNDSNPNHRLEFFEKFPYFFVKTDDGSYSIKSKEINNKVEVLHTSTGAISESFEKFIKPLKLDYNKDITILDVCGGLGYNSSAMIANFLENSNNNTKTNNNNNNNNNNSNSTTNNTNLSIDIVEISPETLAAGLIVPSPIESHNIIKKAIENKLISDGFAKLHLEKSEIPENIDINIFCEDARKTVAKLKSNSYDAIFLDPFSQNMSPELFTVDFFKELNRILKPNGIIATYTSSAPVRYGFIEAGFHIGLGPIFGRKQGGTLASLNPNILDKSLPKNDEIRIAISDVGIPFRDKNLNLTSEEILENRKIERENARHNTKISSAVKTPIFLGEDIEDEALKRRVERNLAKVNIPGVKSEEAYYIIQPQNDYSEESNSNSNSKDRIHKMDTRFQKILNSTKII
ncbi:MAG: MnmC family methyltransferase [Methanobacteriaceae archaeon]